MAFRPLANRGNMMRETPIPGYSMTAQDYARRAFQNHGYQIRDVNGSGINFIASRPGESLGVIVSMRDRRANNNPEVTYKQQKINAALSESAGHGAEAAVFIVLVDNGIGVHSVWTTLESLIHSRGASAYYNPMTNTYSRSTLSFKIDEGSRSTWVPWS